MSHMAASITYEEGKADYYEGVPRYKCRFDEDNLVFWWEKGWDAASMEHDLFTSKQQLQEKVNELGELQKISDRKDKERESVLYDLNDLLVYVHGLGKLSFSREKMETRIRSIVRGIQEGKTGSPE